MALTILTLFLVAYSAMILAWQDFAHWDDGQFTLSSIRGIPLPPQISARDGRFFPLGLQEFNLVGHLTKTVAGYFAFSIAELATLVFVLLVWQRQLSIISRSLIAVAALLTPGIVISFEELIYPERNLLLLLVCFALFVALFEETHSVLWAVGVVICAQIMLYLKEPVFLLLLGFSVSRLLWRGRKSKVIHSAPFNPFRDEVSRLDICIAVLSLLFAAYYAIMMFPHREMNYLVGMRRSSIEALRFYIGSDWLAWIFFATVLVRTYRIFRGRTAGFSVLDALAVGGAIYFVTYLGLALANYHYLAPVDLIAIIYFGNLLFSSWGSMRLPARVAASVLIALVLYKNLSLSAFLVVRDKYMVQQKAAIASLILNRYQRDPKLVRNLYFPFTGAYLLSEFVAYLSYRGLPLEDVGSGSALAAVHVFGRHITTDGRCVETSKFVCHPGPPVDAGSLVVVLPDDWGAFPPDTRLYMKSGKPLRLRDVRTHIAVRLRPLANRLWGTDYWPTAYVGTWNRRVD